YLEKLEIGLSCFSFGELGTEEAVALKKSFDRFKHGLEDKVFGPDGMKQLTALYKKVGIQPLEDAAVKPDIREPGESDLGTLLMRLENTSLNNEQRDIVKAWKKLAKHSPQIDLPTEEIEPKSLSTYIEYIESDQEFDNPQHEIGMTSGLQECMGHMDLMEEVVRLFEQNTVEFIGCSKIQLEKGDFAGLLMACQKVAPNLRMMKTHGLLETVQQMAVQCSTDQDLRHLDFLYGQFLKEFPVIQEQVNFEMELLRSM